MMVVPWRAFIVIQMFMCFEKSFEIISNPAFNGSVATAPKIFYANRNYTALAKATNGISKMQFDSGSLTRDDDSVPVINDNVKKYSEPAVDGNWGNWGNWGPASKTCDEGLRERKRICNNPAPRSGGKECEGDDADTKLFEMGRCVLKRLDTEFRKFNMGMWKHSDGSPGFFWKVTFAKPRRETRFTGPSMDATGDGYYLLADSSSKGRQREDQAIIISEMLTPAPKVNRACLKFRYHMFGSGMGLLTVKISRNSRKPKEIWQAYGDHGDQWVKAKVTLKSSVKFQVLFVAALGKPRLSDIALDSIYVDNGPCRCQDEFLSCRDWAREGKCNDVDDSLYYFMADKCRSSCKTCGCRNLERSKNCRRWAEEGYCPTHQTWMSAHCQLSCRLCTCHDNLPYDECQARVGAYECQTQPQWMADKCTLSCGFCECKNIAGDGECHRRMTIGECGSNAHYMSSNCKYSCGYCNCKDRHSHCPVWAAEGECSRNPTWMHVYCTLSCGECRCHDSNVNCKKWKAMGECHNNPLYMNAFCQKSCEICLDNSKKLKNS